MLSHGQTSPVTQVFPYFLCARTSSYGVPVAALCSFSVPFFTHSINCATSIRLSSLLADVFGRALHYAACAFLSLLPEVLGPGARGAFGRRLDGPVVLCHDVVAAHAQCKDEASEYTRFERHGNADTPELKSVPEWLEEKLAKTLRKNIKMLKNDTKFQAQTERANFCSFPTENAYLENETTITAFKVVNEATRKSTEALA
mmetsp:Transcript_5789/g.13685  ORF Transcript_5789/g.13685 Transcript_5789/m.13685 type:complete len:201 (+) Transcript_5789:132-734(+)